MTTYLQETAKLNYEDSGVTLISPCILFEWAIEFDDGAEILDFYRRAREALGERLTHYSTGEGGWKAFNKRAETLVPTWCENPTPFPKKFYCFLANGADAGATASSMRIDFAHRPYVDPDAAALKQWRSIDQRSLPSHTMLSMTLPLDHPIVESGDVVDWLSEFDIVARRRFISGSCGIGLNFPINFATSEVGAESRNRVAALLRRYPGLDIRSIMVGVGNKLRQRDPEFADRHQAAKARPYLKRVNWLTFLSEDQVDWIGGVATIRDQLAGTEARIRAFAHGVCIQACPTPEIGDTSRDDYVDAYHPIAMLVRPVRIDAVSGGSLPSDFRAHGAQDWLDAFDRDQKERT
ncbi:hypothetical protein GCM10027093_54830 [Paraburkholderia jirisanensis]